jgi:DNA-binding transcriptional LysR family regulator
MAKSLLHRGATIHFDLADLRLFVSIAEAGTLTLGARRAFLSPAAASARLKSLEEQIGQRLLYRDNHGVALTLAGDKLLRHARIILRQVEHAKSDFSDGLSDLTGHIRIFANTTAVTEFMPEILGRFMTDRPRVTVELLERPARDVVRGVVDGAVDLGIIAGPTPIENLKAIQFSTDRMVLVTPVGHPLAGEGAIAFSETLPYEHVTLHEGSSLNSFLQEIVAQQGRPLVTRIQLRSFEVMCRMIEAGVGVGMLPESAAIRYSKNMRLTLRPLSDNWAIRERKVLVRDLDALPACAQALIAAIVAHFGMPQ